jgi:hypothetical protein
MKKQESINSKGNSHDVYEGPLEQVIAEVKSEMKETFNMPHDAHVRETHQSNVDGVDYKFFEAYYDSGSVDYIYFCVK